MPNPSLSVRIATCWGQGSAGPLPPTRRGECGGIRRAGLSEPVGRRADYARSCTWKCPRFRRCRAAYSNLSGMLNPISSQELGWADPRPCCLLLHIAQAVQVLPTPLQQSEKACFNWLWGKSNACQSNYCCYWAGNWCVLHVKSVKLEDSRAVLFHCQHVDVNSRHADCRHTSCVEALARWRIRGQGQERRSAAEASGQESASPSAEGVDLRDNSSPAGEPGRVIDGERHDTAGI